MNIFQNIKKFLPPGGENNKNISSEENSPDRTVREPGEYKGSQKAPD